jgi:hypothetical protein
MTTAQLTPVADQTPAIADIHDELSGAQWVGRFPGTKEISDLEPGFRAAVTKFIAALDQAGATNTPTSTYRPPKRCYLMHWSWRIVYEHVDPHTIPAMDGVNIEWVHPTPEESLQAAKDMVAGYRIGKLDVAPALGSLHTARQAIDLPISWSETLSIIDADGNTVEITTTPRNEMNAELHRVAASYGVIKFKLGYKDRPHWSTTGG